MKLSRILGVTCFGLLFLPLVFIEGQDQKKKAKRAIDLIGDAEKELWKAGKVEDRRKAVEELYQAYGRLGDIATTLATRGLNDPDDAVRVKSAQALARMGPSACRGGDPIDFLIKALEKDKLPEVRLEAANALGSILWEGNNPNRAQHVIPALIKALKHDEDTLVKRSACYAFRMIGLRTKDAASVILEVMKETDDAVLREIASRALCEVITPDSTKLYPALIDMIKAGFKDDDVETSVWVALGRLDHQDESVIPLMINTLKQSKRPGIRASAARILGKHGPKSKNAVPHLVAALEDFALEKQGLRDQLQNSILISIGDIGPEAHGAVPAIRKLASDPKTDENVRATAKRVLQLIEQ